MPYIVVPLLQLFKRSVFKGKLKQIYVTTANFLKSITLGRPYS